MSSQKPKKGSALKVQVSFEVSRVSDDSLASAYERVIPVRRRRTRTDTQHSLQSTESAKETFEQINSFDSFDFG